MPETFHKFKFQAFFSIELTRHKYWIILAKLLTMIQEKSIYAILEGIKPLNILLVDDDMASQFIIAKCLENLGDHLDICSSPEEALDRVTEKNYDLIRCEHIEPDRPTHKPVLRI